MTLYKSKKEQKVEERDLIIASDMKCLSVIKERQVDEYLSLMDEHAHISQEIGEKKTFS